MNSTKQPELDDAVLDLGAATATTLGVDDPIMKESLIVPHARDM